MVSNEPAKARAFDGGAGLSSGESLMGVDVANPLRLRQAFGRVVSLPRWARPARRIGINALLGMGLWILLWLGYNTGPGYLTDSRFPANTADLIHGLRSYFPILGGWIALLVIFSRAHRIGPWLKGPLGLMLIYAVIGLASSAILSADVPNALYYGTNYLAVVLVLLAVVLTRDPIQDLRRLLNLTWAVGILLTLSLLAAVPILGPEAMVPSEGSPVGMRAYAGAGTMMGMALTRNTGFARYAAISVLVTLPVVIKRGRLWVRGVFGILFVASAWALFIANGRTEIVACAAGVAVILFAEKTTRTINILVAATTAILLWFKGFYSGFFLYFTRTGEVDPTMTGRTATWNDGLRLLAKSPWIGLGFQADRAFLGVHMHNAFLHVLVQSGMVGGGAILLALGIIWYYLIKHFFLHPPADRTMVPPEIPAVFLFVTISSITESTFAYFSAAWLLSAPIVAYAVALHRRQKAIARRIAQGRAHYWRWARQKTMYLGPPPGKEAPEAEEVPSAAEEDFSTTEADTGPEKVPSEPDEET
jgi:O-antigen ligase